MRFRPELAGRGAVCLAWPSLPHLQEGPQCGLVALATAAGRSVAEVQRLAVERGHTRQGEMFSAAGMAELATELLGRPALVQNTAALLSSPVDLQRSLAAGHRLLLPYDCAPGHGPALLGGRKAHWALLAGLAFLPATRAELPAGLECWQSEEGVVVVPPDTPPHQAVVNNYLRHYYNHFCRDFNCKRRLIVTVLLWQLAGLLDRVGVEVLVVGRQSKSLVLGLWDRQELIDSNNNLKTLGCERQEDQYVVSPVMPRHCSVCKLQIFV